MGNAILGGGKEAYQQWVPVSFGRSIHVGWYEFSPLIEMLMAGYTKTHTHTLSLSLSLPK
jgi:hypothetical protein